MFRLFACFFALYWNGISCLEAQTWQEYRSRSDRSVKLYDIGAASDNLEKALSLLQQEPGYDPLLLDSMKTRLATLYTACMRYEKSIPLLRHVITSHERGGENDTAYIQALAGLAAAYIYVERNDSAYLLLRQSDSLRAKYHDANVFLHAGIRMLFSRYHMATGDLDSALVCSTEAGRLYKGVKQECVPELTLALSTSAYICMQMGDLYAANRFMKETNSLITSPLQSYHPYILESFINLAECAAVKGHNQDAQNLYGITSGLISFK